jgi:hypothetical protein
MRFHGGVLITGIALPLASGGGGGGIGKLYITAGRICYSCLWRGPKKINNVMGGKRHCISLPYRVYLVLIWKRIMIYFSMQLSK